MRSQVDFLVIGAGVAGLSFALRVADYGKVCVITKSDKNESNTNYAQGGIAAVISHPDTYEKHVKDTLVAGAGLCDEDVVRTIITESTSRIEELVSWGVNFDKNNSGSFDLAKEGGHSEYRVLHYKDKTGSEIIRGLLEKAQLHPNIEILENYFAVDIVTQHHLGIEVKRITTDICCYGAYVLNPNTQKVDLILAKKTLMATGGIGMVYYTTTNPCIATGDGIAMVYRAKGKIENMEFVQFHPTSLYNPNVRPSFLISEAVRGFGGILRTNKMEEFMQKYDERKSLAPRDIVARAIDNEMKISGEDHVYLDCTHLNKEKLIEKFPNIYAKCLSLGFDMAKDCIPVVPAAHYLCGGIKVNKNGQSSILNLYAVGECSSTGMHGANRLASNSLLEAVVYSARAANNAITDFKNICFQDFVPDWNAEGTVHPEEMVLITQNFKEVQAIMSNYVGIVRSNLRLNRAFNRLAIIYRETEDLYEKSVISPKLCELRNAINVSYLIIKMAMARKESRGLHYNIDYPQK